jgi:hypothetical protein
MDYSPTTTSLGADVVPLSSSSQSSKCNCCPRRRPNPPYLDEHLHSMREQEASHHYGGVCDYLQSSSSSLPPRSDVAVAVTPEERKTMILWSYDVVDACSIDREIACIAASYFDRFMSLAASSSSSSSSLDGTATSGMRRAICLARDALLSRKSFQLVYIVCLAISLKCRGGIIADANFVSETICQGRYAARELIEAEMGVLVGLDWRLNGPSAHEFVDGILRSSTSSEMRDYDECDCEFDCESSSSSSSSSISYSSMVASASRARIEESVLDYDASISKLPSAVARDAILDALRETSMSKISIASME